MTGKSVHRIRCKAARFIGHVETDNPARCAYQRQRIVAALPEMDIADFQLRLLLLHGFIHRIVLKNQQRFKEWQITGNIANTLYFDQRRILILPCLRLLHLQPFQEFGKGLFQKNLRPHRQRVDEQANHGFNTG